MYRGLYISALGMTTQMQKMDVVSNNIANVNTTGYKRDFAVTRSFAEELTRILDDPSNDSAGVLALSTHDVPVGKWSQGLYVDDIYTDFSNGSLQLTNAPLDLAISGNGFFCVSASDGTNSPREMYTRDGSFTLAADGTLMTSEGNKVLGREGVIVIPNGSITIDNAGRVYSGGEYVDTLKMTDIEDYHTLRKSGDNLYDITENSVQTAFRGNINQGFLESSNVNSIKEMVDMINVSRLYDTNQRMITLHDQLLGRAVSDIARR